MRNKGWLISDWDHRSPSCALHDIDTGKYLDELSKLPGNMLQLLEDGDVHCQVEEIDGRYQVVKVVAKRDPEFTQGTEKCFATTTDGRKVPVTEEQLDELLGIYSSPDDVYASDEVELLSINTEYTTPRDIWDVVFDATDFIRVAQQRLSALETVRYQLEEAEADPCISPSILISLTEKYKQAREAVREISGSLSDELIYSADWFPRKRDKRFSSNRAKEIARRILSEDLTKQEMGRLINKPRPDTRPQKLRVLLKEAEGCSLGKRKASLTMQARTLSQSIGRDKFSSLSDYSQLPSTDIKKLWSLWQERQIQLHGQVKLQSWQFEAKYSVKLSKQVVAGQITREEADLELQKAMSKLFSQKSNKTIATVETNPMDNLAECFQQSPPELPILLDEEYTDTALDIQEEEFLELSISDDPEEMWASLLECPEEMI